MSEADRLSVCRHVLTKLEAYFRSLQREVTIDELKQRTRVFESDTFARAPSRKEYLRLIAEGMTGMEKRTAQNNAIEAGSGEASHEALMTADHFKQAMKEASEQLRKARLLVLGSARRGKTSTIRSLRGKPFDHSQKTTEGVELSRYYVLPGMHALGDEDVQERIAWESFEGKTRRLRNTLLLSHLSHSTAAIQEVTQGAPQEASAFGSNQRIKNIFERAQGSWKKPFKLLDHQGNVLRCWDFGGQREYEMAHEVFVSSRSILMFVFNLALYAQAESSHAEVDELARWMQIAYSVLSEPQKVQVIIVGTHMKSCQSKGFDVSTCLEALHYDLDSRLSAPVFDSWIRQGSISAATILPLENEIARDDPKGSGLDDLSKTLTLCSQTIINGNGKIPLRWLAFIEMLQTYDALYFTKSEIVRFAQGFPGFDTTGGALDQEVMALLRFFRDLGEVFLYETVVAWMLWC